MKRDDIEKKLTREETRAVLKKRAQDLAREPERTVFPRDFMEVVAFLLSQETYGIAADFVREVYPLRDITPVPCTPSFVLGIVNVRGRIISIVDLRVFFNLPAKGLGDLNKIIIIRNETMEFGILADVILGTRHVPNDAIQPTVPTVTGIGAEYLKGVTADGVIVIDGDAILRDERIVVHEELEHNALTDFHRRNNL